MEVAAPAGKACGKAKPGESKVKPVTGASRLVAGTSLLPLKMTGAELVPIALICALVAFGLANRTAQYRVF